MVCLLSKTYLTQKLLIHLYINISVLAGNGREGLVDAEEMAKFVQEKTKVKVKKQTMK